MKLLSVFFSWSVLLLLVLSFSPLSRADVNCNDLAQIDKILFHKYNTGILTKSEDGKIVFTFGTVFDSHSSLLQHASVAYGRVNEILWAGELGTKDNQIQEVNETAGIMVRATSGLVRKVSDVGNLKSYYEKHPMFRKVFGPHPKLIAFDPNTPPPELHLFSKLTDLSKFRHDIVGKLANVSTLGELLSTDSFSAEELPEMIQILKKETEEALKMIEVADQYGFKCPRMTREIMDKFKSILVAVKNEGLNVEPSVNESRFSFIKDHYLCFSRNDQDIQSIYIETESPADE